jgi:hypothetical protein
MDVASLSSTAAISGGSGLVEALFVSGNTLGPSRFDRADERVQAI